MEEIRFSKEDDKYWLRYQKIIRESNTSYKSKILGHFGHKIYR